MTRTPSTRSGAPSPVMLKLAPIAAATPLNVVFSSLMSRYCPSENQSRATFSPGDRCQRIAMRPASGYGSGRRTSAFAALKIAVFAPMPIASDRIATAVNAGALRAARAAPCRRSLRQLSMMKRFESFLD